MVAITFLAALCGIFASSLGQQPEVTTSLGLLRGHAMQTASGRDFHAFEGIPYAKPPIGKHRFKQSVPNLPWIGVLNATRMSNICMQQQMMASVLGHEPSSDTVGTEDCLYLNVYTPKLTAPKPSDKLLNVLVEIHGGGYNFGFGHMSGPSYVLDQDVVLVTLNYRLGILGFLSFEDSVVPGNNGLKDQLLALQWVNKHIAAFGGDPNKVTIAGVSAGGASVQLHMLSPLSKGLFQKAISNSGSTLNPWGLSRNAKKRGLFIAESVGCPTNNTLVTVKCLRERTAEQLVSAVDLLTKNADYFTIPLNGIKFAPVIETPSPNAFIQEHPIDLIKSNAGSDVPVLFSYAIDEGATFLTKPFFDMDKAQMLDDAWDEKLPAAIWYDGLLEPTREKEVSQALRKKFLGDKKLVDNLGGYSKMLGERLFNDGIQKSSLLHAQHQTSPVYVYRFNFDHPKEVVTIMDDKGIDYKAGATHGEDNFYVFSFPFGSIAGSPEALAMKDTMINLWFKFINENPCANWSTADSKSPQLTFLEITSSNPKDNVFVSEDTIGAQFWDSLNIPLDPPLKMTSGRISERNEL